MVIKKIISYQLRQQTFLRIIIKNQIEKIKSTNNYLKITILIKNYLKEHSYIIVAKSDKVNLESLCMRKIIKIACN